MHRIPVSTIVAMHKVTDGRAPALVLCTLSAKKKTGTRGNGWVDEQSIVDCGGDIAKRYQDIKLHGTWDNMSGGGGGRPSDVPSSQKSKKVVYVVFQDASIGTTQSIDANAQMSPSSTFADILQSATNETTFGTSNCDVATDVVQEGSSNGLPACGLLMNDPTSAQTLVYLLERIQALSARLLKFESIESSTIATDESTSDQPMTDSVQQDDDGFTRQGSGDFANYFNVTRRESSNLSFLLQ
jgi:hypothetical protein